MPAEERDGDTFGLSGTLRWDLSAEKCKFLHVNSLMKGWPSPGTVTAVAGVLRVEELSF
jgi:hypothetical protein